MAKWQKILYVSFGTDKRKKLWMLNYKHNCVFVLKLTRGKTVMANWQKILCVWFETCNKNKCNSFDDDNMCPTCNVNVWHHILKQYMSINNSDVKKKKKRVGALKYTNSKNVKTWRNENTSQVSSLTNRINMVVW